MKYKRWNPASGTCEHLSAPSLRGIPPLVAAVLCARGLDTPEKARSALASDESLLCDPLLLPDMAAACARMERAISANEYIAVYGDYDVDGITATCLLTHYLRSRGARVLPYIPDRLEEGYGLNAAAMNFFFGQGVSLVVTVDCGITAVAETDYATRLGMDVVITDHHACKDMLPAAAAVVNPQRPDSNYPFTPLAGVGVALKLVLALGGEENRSALLAEYADLAAIGTVADVMCLTGENRAIVRMGLDALANPRRPGLKALFWEAGCRTKEISASHVGYSLAPRLNAAGRMGQVALSLELLMTEDEGRALSLARALGELNRQRQQIEGDIFDACVARLEREQDAQRTALVLAGESWHQGVAGIVASRLTERYACPAFIICLQNGVGKGSCRSCAGINLFSALSACSDLLEDFGGHPLAAGFTIREENIPAFSARIAAQIAAGAADGEPGPVLDLDVELSDFSLLTPEGVCSLSMLEPCGAGNPRPAFSLSSATVTCLAAVGNGRHLKLKLTKGSRTLDAIFFSAAAGCALAQGDKVDVAFYPQINEFRGVRSVQLQVLDLRPALTRAQLEMAIYERLRGGGSLTAQEAGSLIPCREEFAAVWRYLKGCPGPPPVEDTPCRLAKCVAHTSGLRASVMRTMVCLDVLGERGLISAEQDTDHLRIFIREEQNGKVALEDSPILKRLHTLAAPSSGRDKFL